MKQIQKRYIMDKDSGCIAPGQYRGGQCLYSKFFLQGTGLLYAEKTWIREIQA
jgi:hypothetical protein